jgi:uncharacterized protein (TIGR02996 family)
MKDEAAFLKALRENPADDTTRLVYADWLDERGDPRAEFIRLRQQHAELTARINELSEQFDPAWLAAVGGPELKSQELRLRSGRWLWLHTLRQSQTYAGTVTGLPTREYNRRCVEHIVARQRERFHRESYLIQPRERPFVPGEGPGSPDTQAMLPSIVCVGEFESTPPVGNSESKGSELVVIWFQDEFAFPIDPAVREQIRAIDWEKHAVDFDY